jgi:SAM-dependent methyltransferase
MTAQESAPTYAQTRQAWRDIWQATDFGRELATLDYPRAQELLALYVPFLDKRAPVLEAGCGPAHIVWWLRQRGYTAFGLDYAPEALRSTRTLHADLPLHLGDVHALPYAAASFGAYLSFGVVEHFEHGPLPALREAYRVLRPGGVLVLTTPHPNFVEALRRLKDRLTGNRAPRAAYYETSYGHEQLAAFVGQAGFQVLRVVPYGHSFTFYGLAGVFRAPGYYRTSRLAEWAAVLGKRLAPWATCFECLVVARR